jgi:hypothetical protein
MGALMAVAAQERERISGGGRKPVIRNRFENDEMMPENRVLSQYNQAAFWRSLIVG